MVKSLIISGCVNPTTSTANTTQFWFCMGMIDKPSSEDRAEIPIFEAGVLSRFGIRITANSINGSTVFTLRKNQTDTTITCSIPANTTAWIEDLTHTETIASGDKFCIKSVPGAATGTFSISMSVMVFTPTALMTCLSKFAATVPNRTQSSASQIGYYTPNGYMTNVVTNESLVQTEIKTPGSWRNFSIISSVNGRSTTTNFNARKNGANTSSPALSVSLTAGETTRKTDTDVHSLVVDDLIDYQWVNGTGVGGLFIWNMSSEFITTGNTALSVYPSTSGEAVPTTRATTSYLPFVGYYDANITNEALCQLPIPEGGFTAKNLSAKCSSNTISPESSSLTLRKNGADTALSVSIPSGTTAWVEDLSNSVVLAEDDLVNFKLVAGTGSSTQALTLRGYTVMLEATNPPSVATNVATLDMANRFITKV